MELYIAARRVKETLKSVHNVSVSRMLVGNFMSAIDMPGMSITLLPLNDKVPVSLIDAQTSAPAWPGVSTDRSHPEYVEVKNEEKEDFPKISKDSTIFKAIKGICDLFIEKSSYLTELDRKAGDGDMGISMERGAKAVLNNLESFPSSTSDAIRSLATCIQQHTGGILQ